MNQNEKEVIEYTDAAARLAESVRRDLQRDGQICKDTVRALNRFIIAANALSVPESTNNLN